MPEYLGEVLFSGLFEILFVNLFELLVGVVDPLPLLMKAQAQLARQLFQTPAGDRVGLPDAPPLQHREQLLELLVLIVHA
jgi:hypothetical protein